MWASFIKIALLVFVISVLWTKYRGAPWAPTPMSMVQKMLTMAHVGPGDVVYDLGCGDGRMLVTAVRRYGARAVGIEIDPLRYAWCQVLITLLGLRDRVRIIYGDFYRQDLSDADVVTCYLLQSTNIKLQAKFKVELRPDTRVVTNFFTFPKLNLVSRDDEDKIYVYALKP